MIENDSAAGKPFHARFLALPRWQRVLLLVFLAVNVVYYCGAFVLFGGDCIFTPHDNFDSVNAWFEMFRQNGLFLSINRETPCFLGLSSSNFGFINFSLQSLLFACFDNFTAFALNYCIAFFLGLAGMALLLETVLPENTFLNLLVAMLYAALPVCPSYAIGAATMPFLFWALYKLYPTGRQFDRRVLLLVFFPFFSLLTGIGFFLIAVWALAALVWIVTKRTLPVNLLAGLAALCAGSVLVELRLIWSVLFGSPMNRAYFNLAGSPLLPQFKQYFIRGYYHVASLQDKVILPVVLLFLAALLVSVCLRRRFRVCSKREAVLLLALFGAIAATSFLGALYGSRLLNGFFKRFLPFLDGFAWGRFWVLNRVFWYAAFAICLKAVSRLPKCSLLVAGLALLQMFFIATRNDWEAHYNYAVNTWVNELIREPRDLPPSDDMISYNAFYDKVLFDRIKADLDYDGENVAAVGYHPAVLMYNGFHCVDGYLNAYEYAYMQKFRTLIRPQLEYNEADRAYYDSWGGRMYLYCDGASSEPTWEKYTEPATLRVDPVVMRRDFDLRYILSRAPIGNVAELGLVPVNEYHTDGLYDIYVYQVQ